MMMVMMAMIKMANHLYPEKAVYPVRAFLVSTKLPRTSCSQTRSSWSSLDMSFNKRSDKLDLNLRKGWSQRWWWGWGSTCVSWRTMLLLAEFPLFLWVRRSSMIIIFMDIAIMVVMIVAEYIMSLLSTRFPFLWTLTSDQQRLRLTQPRHRFWRATPWGQILKTNVFSCFLRLRKYKILVVIYFENVHQPSSKCIKWTSSTSYLCLTKKYHTFSNTLSGCTPGEPTHTCSCRPGRHPPWRRRWRSRGRPCGRRTGTASGPNRNQSL